MKIQIDTNAKTIKVEEDVQIAELIDTLQRLFPDGEYKQYRLLTNTVFDYSYPIVPIYIKRWEPVRPYWEYYWHSPNTCEGTVTSESGVVTSGYSQVDENGILTFDVGR